MTEPTLSDLPRFRLDQLDPDDYLAQGTSGSTRDWQQLWDFARSFDGYAYFGGDDEAPQRLWDFNLSIRDAYQGSGRMPVLSLDLLRACLFVEASRLVKADRMTVMQRERKIHPTSVRYLQVLLDEIAERLR